MGAWLPLDMIRKPWPGVFLAPGAKSALQLRDEGERVRREDFSESRRNLAEYLNAHGHLGGDWIRHQLPNEGQYAGTSRPGSRKYHKPTCEISVLLFYVEQPGNSLF